MGQVLPALRLRCLLQVEIAVRGAVLDAVLDAMPGFVRGAVRRAVRYAVRCKGASGWAAALQCGGLRFAATSLRCSGPGGERRARPYARCAVTGAQTTSLDLAFGSAPPEPLRSSAPHRRAAAHPLAPLQSTLVLCEEHRSGHCGSYQPKQRHRRLSQSRGRAAGAAPLRRRAAQRERAVRLRADLACLRSVLRPSFRGHPRTRAAQRSRSAAQTAALKRSPPPTRGLAPPHTTQGSARHASASADATAPPLTLTLSPPGRGNKTARDLSPSQAHARQLPTLHTNTRPDNRPPLRKPSFVPTP